MKFQKFVKALGSDGIVYNRKNGERFRAGVHENPGGHP